jgi:hypothetical protein
LETNSVSSGVSGWTLANLTLPGFIHPFANLPKAVVFKRIYDKIISFEGEIDSNIQRDQPGKTPVVSR